jgi:hypothetical protein
MPSTSLRVAQNVIVSVLIDCEARFTRGDPGLDLNDFRVASSCSSDGDASLRHGQSLHRALGISILGRLYPYPKPGCASMVTLSFRFVNNKTGAAARSPHGHLGQASATNSSLQCPLSDRHRGVENIGSLGGGHSDELQF